MPKITKRAIDALKPDPDGEIFAWDSELKGFGVRMMPTGVASYVLKYRNREGRQRKMTLGRVGALTPEEARNLARQRLAEVAQGADPSAERTALRKAMTVGELADAYLADADGRVKASTLAMHRSQIERHIKPLIGKRTVTSVTATDAAKMQADIIAGKTAAPRAKGRGGITTGGKGAARRAVALLAAILEFARKRKLIAENAARGIERPADRKLDRFLKAAEIKALGKAMRDAIDDGENETPLAAIRFLLLTGHRRNEVLALPEKWLDAEGSCVRYGDTKRGAQIRPVGASAIAAIEDTPRRNGWVFPAARGKGHFVGLPKVLERLCDRAKLEDVTIHTMRHTFAATAAEMGYSELTIAGLLGHKIAGITARYAHVADSALVAAADRVSARIAEALDGEAEGKVVKLPVRKRKS